MKVMIACPNLGWVHKNIWLETMRWVAESPLQIQVLGPSEKCNEANYQTIAKRFWESDFDYLLQIDADNPPLKNPLDLVAFGKDVITLPTPIWVYDEFQEMGDFYRPFQWNVYEYLKEQNRYRTLNPPQAGQPEMHTVDATGAGCLLMHRRIWDAPLMRKEGWHRKWDKESGIVRRGLDLAFSERLKKCGFKIHTHWGYRCRHFKELDVLEVLKGFQTWVADLVRTNGGELTFEKLGMPDPAMAK